MSDSSSDIAGLIAEASQIQFANCVAISGTALIFYDYALTFSTEVSEVWNSKFSGAQALFLLTRYSYLVVTLLYCANTLSQNPSETLCQVLLVNMNVWITMTQIGLYSMLILRTFAIYQKNQFILVILGLTAVANVASGLYDSVLGKSEVDSDVLGSTCGEIEVSTIHRLLLAEIISSLVFDILLFTLTTAKTIRHTIEMRKVGLGNGLGYFILRDGAMYFLAKLLIGVVGTTIFFVPASGAIGNWLTVLGAISNPLTIILITRLVLNLKQVSHSRNGNSPTHGTIGTIEEPVFTTNSFLGNLGAPLRMGPEVDEIEEIGVGDGAESAGL